MRSDGGLTDAEKKCEGENRSLSPSLAELYVSENYCNATVLVKHLLSTGCLEIFEILLEHCAVTPFRLRLWHTRDFSIGFRRRLPVYYDGPWPALLAYDGHIFR